jgi:outer membrane protein assembly factor BamB
MIRTVAIAVAGLLFCAGAALAQDPRPFSDLTVEAQLPVWGGYLTATKDAVWTFDHPNMRLVRIDAATNGVSETTLPGYVGFQYPFALGENAIWLPDLGTRGVIKIDDRSGAELMVVGAGMMTSNGVAVVDGSVWIGAYDRDSDRHMVIRYDAETGAEQVRIPSPEPIFNLIGAGGYVWVNRLRQLVHIDPETNSFGGGPAGEFEYPMWTGGGFLFAKSDRGGTMHQIDPASGALVRQIEMPDVNGSVNAAIGNGDLWVGTQSNELLQIDLATGTMERFQGPSAVGLAFAAGSLWALNAEAEQIWRIGVPK